MSKMPPIPKEQRSYGARRPSSGDDPHARRHDGDTQNLAEQGQQANMRQNVMGRHQDR
jgi:hypothetical protein